MDGEIDTQAEVPPKQNQDAAGRFVPGNCANPEGYQGPKGYQRYGVRAAALTDKYTVREIIALSEDRTKLEDLPYFDGLAIQQLAAAFKADEKAAAERERLLDRTEGKPMQAYKDESDRPPPSAPVLNVFVTAEKMDK